MDNQAVIIFLAPIIEALTTDVKKVAKKLFNMDMSGGALALVAQILGFVFSAGYELVVNDSNWKSAVAYGVASGGLASLLNVIKKYREGMNVAQSNVTVQTPESANFDAGPVSSKMANWGLDGSKDA